ncbi:MAG: glycosyltransferase family 39 protein [Chloroflexota bacterium]|nr:glycosyltransferase family 39 protein [Chloroflexota bacterium]
MKYLKIGKYELFAAAVIAFATGLRIVLIALNWPPTNSDEGVMGIIAMHIAYHGERPLMFYGQDYMGTIEAYIAALFFHLFGGPSLFALRLGVVLMVACFFIVMYLLTSLLFSKKLALVTLALLSVGSIAYLTRQTLATGGSAETLLFGSLSLLLVAWLALTYQRGAPLRAKLLRCGVYFILGLIVGLAVWSDLVVAPILAVAGLLLLLFCWRDLLFGNLPVVLLGILLGFLPSLMYSMQHHLNPLVTLLSLFHGLDVHPPTTLPGILQDVYKTIVVSIPTATGNPFCPVQELTFLSDNTPRTATCEAIRGVWGVGYLVLLGLALVLACIGLWRLRKRLRSETELSAIERRGLLVRSVARLLMLVGGLAAIFAFAVSAAPVWWPAFHARYLIILLIILPAVIEPLWNAVGRSGMVGNGGLVNRAPTSSLSASSASSLSTSSSTPTSWGWAGVRGVVGGGALVIGALVLLIGTFMTFGEVGAAQRATQNYVNLDSRLVSLGIKHVKSDYWSCYNISFFSGERVICQVVSDDLIPGYNRPPHYKEIVKADPHASYVIDAPSEMPALLRMMSADSGKVYRFDEYVVYTPA